MANNKNMNAVKYKNKCTCRLSYFALSVSVSVFFIYCEILFAAPCMCVQLNVCLFFLRHFTIKIGSACLRFCSSTFSWSFSNWWHMIVATKYVDEWFKNTQTRNCCLYKFFYIL